MGNHYLHYRCKQNMTAHRLGQFLSCTSAQTQSDPNPNPNPICFGGLRSTGVVPRLPRVFRRRFSQIIQRAERNTACSHFFHTDIADRDCCRYPVVLVLAMVAFLKSVGIDKEKVKQGYRLPVVLAPPNCHAPRSALLTVNTMHAATLEEERPRKAGNYRPWNLTNY